MSAFFISPAGSGSADGSSWANAAKIGSLPSLVAKAGPGGEILLRADQGAYSVTGVIAIKSGGADGAPVTIRGVDGAGRPLAAEIVGARDVTSGVTGPEVFRLMNGANDLTFEHLAFRNIGNGAFRFGADVNDIAIRHVQAHNVQRFIEDYASGSNTSATVTGLTVQDVQVYGYSKGVIRLQYDSSSVLIEDVFGDSQAQAHDDFAMGVMLDGTVHNVVIRRATMANNQNSSDGYWNGDGFVTEAGVYGVRFENTRAYGNTDGGYDLKSSQTVLDGAVAEANKRNFRFWGDDVVVMNASGSNPHRYGGSGSQAQVWLGDDAKVTIVSSVFTDADLKTIVYDLSPHSVLTLSGNVVDMAPGAILQRLGAGASVLVTESAALAPQVAGIMGTDGDDTLTGGVADDYMRGGAGQDLIIGGDGFDNTHGNVGSDTIHGGAGPDWVVGGQDSDLLHGDDGDDYMHGNRAADTCLGGAGADTILGGQEADSLSGGDGDDRLLGDRGNDVLSGGPGADRFEIAAGGGVDQVVDFSYWEGDRAYVPLGASYQLTTAGADVIVSLGGGDQLILLGAAGSNPTPDWVVAG